MTSILAKFRKVLVTREVIIALIALVAIGVHLLLRLGGNQGPILLGTTRPTFPLLIALAAGIPLLVSLARHLARGEFSSDLLAGLSIVTSVILGEYLAGTLVVLMLSGGQALEAFAVRRASFALEALAKRLPSAAHRKENGQVGGQIVQVTSRKAAIQQDPALEPQLPAPQGGLECLILIDHLYAATFQFRDEPRSDGKSFIAHLKPRHGFERVLMVSGDRETEARYLAEQVGIQEIFAGQSPEQKLALVIEETRHANSVFMGDGINDAPALTAATVGIAFGQTSEVTSEAAGVVILDSSLERVDELLHIGNRMRTIALQSALGGMILSFIGMCVAAAGYLPPVAGAISQEVIDVLAVLNALRAAVTPRVLSDHEPPAENPGQIRS